MNEDQLRFWHELLAYYHRELQERQSPAMVSMLAFFHSEEHARQDKRLAELGHVYLLKDGKLTTRRIGELHPSDAPHMMAELEATQAMGEEHSVTEDRVTVTVMPGGATFTHPHYEDATGHLRTRWRELKATWATKRDR
ncbi:MAG: hypothetical protein WKF53_08540 [Rubrobacter sp.]